MADPLLKVADLVKRFGVRGGVLQRQVATVHAVNGVSFEIRPGETLALALIYLGHLVEHGAAETNFEYPAHPYTQALLSAVPDPRLRDPGDGCSAVTCRAPPIRRPAARSTPPAGRRMTDAGWIGRRSRFELHTARGPRATTPTRRRWSARAGRMKGVTAP